ncbi:MAG TPA: tRNA (adenosine(37)-N6)-threonylcarbamoyltransferase complex dimerization subunit type 1 TsaB [Pseudolabrys sp.]|nr:tRNA (adenosine(37)-N6)-threonylcarbamoyltransferase complex dimerization subunit type 1 TsaB [Pseudolabrys sp.]
MRVLAIDTALDACSAAALDTENALALHESIPMQRGHAEALMPLIARLLDRSGLEARDFDRIAVTTGPGSFTGLRVGIAAARGIALATGKPAVGLTTLAAFAAPLIAENDTLPVVVAIDARHDHVYYQAFGAGGRTVVTPRILPIRQALHLSAAGSPRITGTAAEKLASLWPSANPQPILVLQRAAVEIDWVARLGAAATDAGSAPRPFYLRAADAHPQEAASLARR